MYRGMMATVSRPAEGRHRGICPRRGGQNMYAAMDMKEIRKERAEEHWLCMFCTVEICVADCEGFGIEVHEFIVVVNCLLGQNRSSNGNRGMMYRRGFDYLLQQGTAVTCCRDNGREYRRELRVGRLAFSLNGLGGLRSYSACKWTKKCCLRIA